MGVRGGEVPLLEELWDCRWRAWVKRGEERLRREASSEAKAQQPMLVEEELRMLDGQLVSCLLYTSDAADE